MEVPDGSRGYESIRRGSAIQVLWNISKTELTSRNVGGIHADVIGVCVTVEPLALLALLPAQPLPMRSCLCLLSPKALHGEHTRLVLAFVLGVY